MKPNQTDTETVQQTEGGGTVASSVLLDHDFKIPWSELRAAREALSKRAQDARCAAVNHTRPEDKALSVLSARGNGKGRGTS